MVFISVLTSVILLSSSPLLIKGGAVIDSHTESSPGPRSLPPKRPNNVRKE